MKRKLLLILTIAFCISGCGEAINSGSSSQTDILDSSSEFEKNSDKTPDQTSTTSEYKESSSVDSSETNSSESSSKSYDKSVNIDPSKELSWDQGFDKVIEANDGTKANYILRKNPSHYEYSYVNESRFNQFLDCGESESVLRMDKRKDSQTYETMSNYTRYQNDVISYDLKCDVYNDLDEPQLQEKFDYSYQCYSKDDLFYEYYNDTETGTVFGGISDGYLGFADYNENSISNHYFGMELDLQEILVYMYVYGVLDYSGTDMDVTRQMKKITTFYDETFKMTVDYKESVSFSETFNRDVTVDVPVELTRSLILYADKQGLITDYTYEETYTARKSCANGKTLKTPIVLYHDLRNYTGIDFNEETFDGEYAHCDSEMPSEFYGLRNADDYRLKITAYRGSPLVEIYNQDDGSVFDYLYGNYSYSDDKKTMYFKGYVTNADYSLACQDDGSIHIIGTKDGEAIIDAIATK